MRGIVGGIIAGLVLVGFSFGGRFPALAPTTGLLHATALPVFTACAAGLAACWSAFSALRADGPRLGRVVFCAIAGLTALVLVALQLGLGPGRYALAAAPDDGRRIRVVQANLLAGNSDYSAVIDRLAHADVGALAEASPDRVRAGLAQRGLAGRFAVVVSAPAAGSDTVLVVRTTLRPRALDSGTLPFAAAGATTSAGRIVAVHTASPSARSLWQGAWASSVRQAAAQCTPGSLVAGDFNASWAQLDPLTGCDDAAVRLHMGAAGSWRTSWPTWLGARIDHQLYDRSAFAPVQASLFEVPGSDHRGTDIVYARRGEGSGG